MLKLLILDLVILAILVYSHYVAPSEMNYWFSLFVAMGLGFSHATLSIEKYFNDKLNDIHKLIKKEAEEHGQEPRE